MYEATVTVFNFYKSASAELWFPHVLTGVDLVTDKGQMLRQYGPDSTDAAELHVAYSGLSPSWEIVHDYEPTLDNEPAVEWISEAEKKKHIGERFYYGDMGRAISRVYQFSHDAETDEWKWSILQNDMKIIVDGLTGEPMLNTLGEPLPWLPPKEWARQVNDMLDDTITFDSREDFFWQGAWEGGPVNDTDYQDRRGGGFREYMTNNYDYVFKITSVGGPYTVIPHFEIRGA